TKLIQPGKVKTGERPRTIVVREWIQTEQRSRFLEIASLDQRPREFDGGTALAPGAAALFQAAQERDGCLKLPIDQQRVGNPEILDRVRRSVRKMLPGA